MARTDRRRIEVKGTLRALTPVLIGGTHEPGLDVVPLRDGAGRVVIPASSLAGVLRHHAIRYLDSNTDTVKWLFGTSDVGASRLRVHELRAHGTPTQTLRDGVGIDRRHGVAAENVKFDRVQLDAGTEFDLCLCYESAVRHDDDDPACDLFHLLVDSLMRGELRVGAGVTRGQGRMQLQNAQRRVIDLCDAESLLTALVEGSDTWEMLDAPTSVTPTGLTVTVHWRPVTPVLSAVSVSDGAVDIAPLVLPDQGTTPGTSTLRMVLPGTSIKGVLRSEVERVVRTLCEEDAPEGFLEQLENPLVGALFGGSRRRSVVAVDDVFSQPVLSRDDAAELLVDWHAMLAVRGDDKSRLVTLRSALDERRKGLTGALIPTAHVAVDRWTGGPVDGALYSVLEPHGFEWEPLVIHIDVDNVGSKLGAGAALALVVLVLGAVTDAEVGFGFGTHRGLGSIAVTSLKASARSGADLVNEVADALNQYRPDSYLLDSINDDLRTRLSELLMSAVDQYLKSKTQRVGS